MLSGYFLHDWDDALENVQPVQCARLHVYWLPHSLIVVGYIYTVTFWLSYTLLRYLLSLCIAYTDEYIMAAADISIRTWLSKGIVHHCQNCIIFYLSDLNPSSIVLYCMEVSKKR